ncbi:hypothetical protein AVEN_181923-1 [Araneus ventricosus]|uniref:Uncharacterized protein n=1 Tax=Araneus ventricosus TaxID=182803 RepID=A0A4Y2JR10_ARAVE|nr:hypothetical protein AVEN_270169-1 [Araneus ventricosus]GBO37587.1 hypothetical protein AVEN_181923-1 [Araneus ventricosus]
MNTSHGVQDNLTEALADARSIMSPCGNTSSARPSPRVRSPTENERFMVMEESASSVANKPWTPEGRSLTSSIAFML